MLQAGEGVEDAQIGWDTDAAKSKPVAYEIHRP